MRAEEQIKAAAADQRAFSNHTEYEIWADSGRGCYDCRHDNPDTETYCPILSVALLGGWPKEWTRKVHRWEIGGKSGAYEVVDECTEFEHRPEPGDEPPQAPPPPPGCAGQVDMFEVFTDQIVEQIEQQPLVEAVAR